MSKKSKMQLIKKMRNTIVVLCAFILVIVLCTSVLRRTLWDHTNQMGMTLVENYTASEGRAIRNCESILTLSLNYVAEREKKVHSIEELREDLYPFIDGVARMCGNQNMRIYGRILGGTEIFSNDQQVKMPQGDGMLDPEYYRAALDARGEIYVSPSHKDERTGETVVTMCKVNPDTGSYLAIDLTPACFDLNNEYLVLPNDSSYYLTDGDGTLLYYVSCWDYEPEDFQALVDSYMKEVKCDDKMHILENIVPSDGIVRSVYFYHLDNGWTGILTIPRDEILSGVDTFTYICVFLVLLSVAVFVFQLVREYLNHKHNQDLREENVRMAAQTQIYRSAMDSTARAYRAIYYVDLKDNMCDTVYPRSGGESVRVPYDVHVKTSLENGIAAEEYVEELRDFMDADNIAERLLDREHMELQFRRRKMNGEGYEWCSVVITVAVKTEEGVLAVTIAIRSIDDMMRREEHQKEALAQALERAETANRAKSDFLSRMSHDIRTPMNAILGMTSVAEMHIDEKERVMDALDKIKVSGKHLLGLINEVLDMNRIESGKISLIESAFNLSDTLESIMTIFRSQMYAKGLMLNASIAKMEHENVIGDEQHLQQIFMNIMGNAVKFTPSGGKISIHIEEKHSDVAGCGCYEFTFEDTGIGMSEEFIQQIFEPFSRAADSRIGKIEGTGLGMTIAVNIARMMNGDIKVESELGKGSRFTVVVYLKLDDMTESDLVAYNGVPVLVVDDEWISCESSCEMLRNIGMDVENAFDGETAVKRVAEAKESGRKFAMVLLDWKMPGMDGLTTTRKIREVMGDDISIVILSAYDWADIEAEALDAGVNAFIGKPLFKSRMIRVLKDVLGGQGHEEKEVSALEVFGQEDFSGRRVLLVEDNEINIEVAKELLNMVGIEVEMAMNGKLAVESVTEKEAGYFDLIFMDIQMPIMNGYEATKAIRASGRKDLEEIPIVAMTADAFADDVKKSQEAGMNGHISKPVDIEKLEEALRRWIR